MLGLSAIIGIGSSAVVLALGLRHRSRRTQHAVLLGLAAAGVVAVVAVVGFAVTAGLGADDLKDGSESAEAGIELMNDGDYRGAAAEFEQAADSFDRASDALTQRWSKPAQVVPIVAQHRTAAVELAATAAAATATAAGDALSLDRSGSTPARQRPDRHRRDRTDRAALRRRADRARRPRRQPRRRRIAVARRSASGPPRGTR